MNTADTLDDVLADVTAHPRFRSALLGSLASVAVLIAAVGLFGAIAYSVAQRRSEIGVRMALGADATRIRSMVLREGVALSATGALLGIVGAVGATRFAEGMLFGTSSTDPASFVLAAGAAVTIGIVASYLPARRASRIDPVAALSAE